MDEQLPAALRDLAATQRGALTGSQITDVISRQKLTRFVRDGVVTRLWRNAYALPCPPADTRTRLKAAEMTMGRPVTACLQTAAELYGFDLDDDHRTHVLGEHDWPNATPGLIQHRYRPVRCPSQLEEMTGPAGREKVSVADLAETAVRLACRQSDPARALAILDRALARTVLDRKDLADVAVDLHIRGVSMTRELIEFADGRAESPGESWLHWVCIKADLPPATPQIAVIDDHGHHYRVDLGWEDLRVGSEYEGVEFHTGDALHRDRARYNALSRQGWLVHGVTQSMIWQHRRGLVADLRSLLDQRSAA